ncbi:MAG: hypothetical protein AVDCRST_MAG77-176, partial [uncultured Chloroflexi bacterium]
WLVPAVLTRMRMVARAAATRSRVLVSALLTSQISRATATRRAGAAARRGGWPPCRSRTCGCARLATCWCWWRRRSTTCAPAGWTYGSPTPSVISPTSASGPLSRATWRTGWRRSRPCSRPSASAAWPPAGARR